jgi:hypothetical protein
MVSVNGSIGGFKVKKEVYQIYFFRSRFQNNLSTIVERIAEKGFF